MAEKDQNDEWYQNNPRDLYFTVVNKDEVGEPVLDLDNYVEIKWALSKYKNDGVTPRKEPVLEKKLTTDGIVILVANEGTLRVRIQDEDTVALLGDYYQELEIFNSDGEGIVVATGRVTLLINLTNT